MYRFHKDTFPEVASIYMKRTYLTDAGLQYVRIPSHY